MATDKQINANRLNGKQGGPKTPAGRAAVRYNALKHGLSAHHPVIGGLEDQAAFDEFLTQLQLDLQPLGLIEHMLVNQIADSHWRRQRIILLETGLFEGNKEKLARHFKATYKSLTTADTLHLVAEDDAQKTDMLGRYYRYDARFERSFFKAWKELKSLQAARKTKPEAVRQPIPNPTRPMNPSQTHFRQTNPNPARTTTPQPPEKPENDDTTM